MFGRMIVAADTPELTGILLAAGESARLGEPKQLLRFQGEPLVRRAAAALLDHCSRVLVVTGAVDQPVMDALAGMPVRIVHNEAWREGMGSSIRRGVECAEQGSAGYLLFVADQPLVGTVEIGKLVEAWRSSPQSIAAAAYANTRGVPAIFPARLFVALTTLGGDCGARSVVDAATDVTVVDMPRAAVDLDTPEDVRGLDVQAGAHRGC